MAKAVRTNSEIEVRDPASGIMVRLGENPDAFLIFRLLRLLFCGSFSASINGWYGDIATLSIIRYPLIESEMFALSSCRPEEVVSSLASSVTLPNRPSLINLDVPSFESYSLWLLVSQLLEFVDIFTERPQRFLMCKSRHL